MDRVRNLINDPDFRQCLKLTAQWEKERHYCRHDFLHLLDVARIAWILCLEQNLAIPRPVVYAAALLHDIGRFAEYENPNLDHAEVSAQLAESLLFRHGFSGREKDTIIAAIRNHRKPPQGQLNSLEWVLAAADDLSRCCFECSASNDCLKIQKMPTADGIKY